MYYSGSTSALYQFMGVLTNLKQREPQLNQPSGQKLKRATGTEDREYELYFNRLSYSDKSSLLITDSTASLNTTAKKVLPKVLKCILHILQNSSSDVNTRWVLVNAPNTCRYYRYAHLYILALYDISNVWRKLYDLISLSVVSLLLP